MTWQERSAEAATLAARADEAEAGARLVALLLHPEDTAVSQAAAQALLARRDIAGLRLFVAAFGQAEEDTRNKLGDCLYDEPDLWSSVRQGMGRLADDDNPAVRAGLRVLGAHMTVEERTHRRPGPLSAHGPRGTEGNWGRRPTCVPVADAFPALAAELEAVLTADNEPDIAKQVRGLVIEAWCRCGDAICQTFETVRRPWPDEVWTLPHDTDEGVLNVDVADGRVVGVETLFYPPLA